MALVSIVVLTKNRASLLTLALASIQRQKFSDIEVIVVNDGSTDETSSLLTTWSLTLPLRIIQHSQSLGIIASRQEALVKSGGTYVAFLDDDDQWVDQDKLTKQVRWFFDNPKGVIVGGSMSASGKKSGRFAVIHRPSTDASIRRSMLFKNPFFTSTVMIRRSTALEVGGFVSDGVDLAEDYDVWLRMGSRGLMYNFRDVFTSYTSPQYNAFKFKQFLRKQRVLIKKYARIYPGYWLASTILTLRILIGL